MFKVMITGNRPFKMDKDKAFIAKRKMFDYLQYLKSIYGDELLVLTGMALGPDQWAAEICTDLKIKFDAYLPFQDQDARWTWHEQQYYEKLLRSAKNIFIAEMNTPVGGQAYHKRNDMLVNDCNYAIAVFNGDYQSGTGSTIRKLERANKQYVNVYPIKEEV